MKCTAKAGVLKAETSVNSWHAAEAWFAGWLAGVRCVVPEALVWNPMLTLEEDQNDIDGFDFTRKIEDMTGPVPAAFRLEEWN